MGGLALSLSLVLVGLQAAREERGKLFGIMGMASPIGALLGGATCGAAADVWGYPTMLRLVGILYALPIVLLWVLRDPETPHRHAAQPGAGGKAVQAGHHGVEDHDIGRPTGELVERALAVDPGQPGGACPARDSAAEIAGPRATDHRGGAVGVRVGVRVGLGVAGGVGVVLAGVAGRQEERHEDQGSDHASP
jgi:hypothetical protein